MDDNDYEAPAAEEPAPEGGDGEAKADMHTELGNIEAFPGAAPGKTYKVEIVKVHEKEVEYLVQPMDEGGEEHAEPEPAMAGDMGGDAGDMM